MKSKQGLGSYGGKYTLNKGHGKCLYDKFGFVEKRFKQILIEMQTRGFDTNYSQLDLSAIPEQFFGEYMPTEEAIELNVERILQRISDKPAWYKYRGVTKDWNKFYNKKGK